MASTASQATSLLEHEIRLGSSGHNGRILGIGCDLVDLPTLQRQLDSPIGQRFVANVLTSAERSSCGDSLVHVAQHWAVKEAIAKAVGHGWVAFSPRDIDLIISPLAAEATSTRAWCVASSDDRAWPDEAHLWTWHLTSSLGEGWALATALAFGSDHPLAYPTASTLERSNP
jgi:phosphopantetheine--protein transferase-like protein